MQLLHTLDRNAFGFDQLCAAFGRIDIEPCILESMRQLRQLILVLVGHGNEHLAALGKNGLGSLLCLEEGLTEGLRKAQYLAR